MTHYTEIKVRRWLLWPKLRIGFLFNMYSWFMLYDEFDIPLSEYKNVSASKILYCSAVAYMRNKSKRVWFTEKDIIRFIKRSKTEESEKIMSQYKKSISVLAENMKGLTGYRTIIA